MTINWTDLGEVFVGTLIAAVAVVALFGAGVVSLSRQTVVKEQGNSGVVQLTSAVVCFALCVAIVLYGIYLIVAK